MSDIFLSSDNTLTYQLQFKRIGSNKIRDYDLTTATEIRMEFYTETNVLITTLSSLSSNNIQISDTVNGIVSYDPNPDDFQNVDISAIHRLRWVVVNPQHPNGLVFSKPPLPVRIIP